MSARKRLGLTGWLLFAATMSAAPPAAPRVVYTNKQNFTVPIRMDDADRAAIRSLKFFVKPPSGGWTLVETGGPATTKFNYSAPMDGEYAFTFVTEDPAGHLSPSHPDKEAPRLVVMVDTRAPEVVVEPLKVASGQTFLQCTIRDTNPDVDSIVAEAALADGTWTPLIAMGKEMPGVFRCPDAGLPTKVRVTSKDRATNVTTLVVALADRRAELPATSPVLDGPLVTFVPPPVPAMPAAVPVPVPAPVAQVAMAPVPAPVAPALIAAAPVLTPTETRVAERAPVPGTAGPARQLLNSPSCSLAYSLDGVAPASVQKVEAYITRDNGQTWQLLGEDPDRASPLDLKLPGEGLLGIALVVHAIGQPGQPPARGEAPDWWVEVDTTPPDVRIDSAVPGTGDDAGMLLLNWSVRERNAAPDSVDLAWAVQADGPWIAIAKGLRSEGQYRWPVPREAFGRVYLKLDATDRAGNLGRFVSPQPVATELGRPRARVIGINPAAVRP